MTQISLASLKFRKDNPPTSNRLLACTIACEMLFKPSAGSGKGCPDKQDTGTEQFAGLQYPAAIDLVQKGRIRAGKMITHRFGFDGLDDVINGFQCAINMHSTKAIKVMFNLPALT